MINKILDFATSNVFIFIGVFLISTLILLFLYMFFWELIWELKGLIGDWIEERKEIKFAKEDK